MTESNLLADIRLLERYRGVSPHAEDLEKFLTLEKYRVESAKRFLKTKYPDIVRKWQTALAFSAQREDAMRHELQEDAAKWMEDSPELFTGATGASSPCGSNSGTYRQKHPAQSFSEALRLRNTRLSQDSNHHLGCGNGFRAAIKRTEDNRPPQWSEKWSAWIEPKSAKARNPSLQHKSQQYYDAQQVTDRSDRAITVGSTGTVSPNPDTSAAAVNSAVFSANVAFRKESAQRKSLPSYSVTGLESQRKQSFGGYDSSSDSSTEEQGQAGSNGEDELILFRGKCWSRSNSDPKLPPLRPSSSRTPGYVFAPDGSPFHRVVLPSEARPCEYSKSLERLPLSSAGRGLFVAPGANHKAPLQRQGSPHGWDLSVPKRGEVREGDWSPSRTGSQSIQVNKRNYNTDRQRWSDCGLTTQHVSSSRITGAGHAVRNDEIGSSPRFDKIRRTSAVGSWDNRCVYRNGYHQQLNYQNQAAEQHHDDAGVALHSDASSCCSSHAQALTYQQPSSKPWLTSREQETVDTPTQSNHTVYEADSYGSATFHRHRTASLGSRHFQVDAKCELSEPSTTLEDQAHLFGKPNGLAQAEAFQDLQDVIDDGAETVVEVVHDNGVDTDTDDEGRQASRCSIYNPLDGKPHSFWGVETEQSSWVSLPNPSKLDPECKVMHRLLRLRGNAFALANSPLVIRHYKPFVKLNALLASLYEIYMPDTSQGSRKNTYTYCLKHLKKEAPISDELLSSLEANWNQEGNTFLEDVAEEQKSASPESATPAPYSPPRERSKETPEATKQRVHEAARRAIGRYLKHRVICLGDEEPTTALKHCAVSKRDDAPLLQLECICCSDSESSDNELLQCPVDPRWRNVYSSRVSVLKHKPKRKRLPSIDEEVLARLSARGVTCIDTTRLPFESPEKGDAPGEHGKLSCGGTPGDDSSGGNSTAAAVSAPDTAPSNAIDENELEAGSSAVSADDSGSLDESAVTSNPNPSSSQYDITLTVQVESPSVSSSIDLSGQACEAKNNATEAVAAVAETGKHHAKRKALKVRSGRRVCTASKQCLQAGREWMRHHQKRKVLLPEEWERVGKNHPAVECCCGVQMAPRVRTAPKKRCKGQSICLVCADYVGPPVDSVMDFSAWPSFIPDVMRGPDRAGNLHNILIHVLWNLKHEPRVLPVPSRENLRLWVGGYMIPHDEKRSRAGDDSWCASEPLRCLGVCDGVGEMSDREWRLAGFDCRGFGEDLLRGTLGRLATLRETAQSVKGTRQRMTLTPGTTRHDRQWIYQPFTVNRDSPPSLLCLESMLSGFYGNQTAWGAATCLVACLNEKGSQIGFANIGDSKGLVLRRPRFSAGPLTKVAGTTMEQHGWNLPLQLARMPSRVRVKEMKKDTRLSGLVKVLEQARQIGLELHDPPESAGLLDVDVQAGDLVVLATDGVWDNLFESEVAALCGAALSPAESRYLCGHPLYGTAPRDVAKGLCLAAYWRSLQDHVDTPFAQAVRQTGATRCSYGGKPDDITVVCAWVVPAEDENNQVLLERCSEELKLRRSRRLQRKAKLQKEHQEQIKLSTAVQEPDASLSHEALDDAFAIKGDQQVLIGSIQPEQNSNADNDTCEVHKAEVCPVEAATCKIEVRVGTSRTFADRRDSVVEVTGSTRLDVAANCSSNGCSSEARMCAA